MTSASLVSASTPAIFESPVFGKVRTVSAGPDGQPWFVARDVCACLGLDNVGQALSALDDDEKASIDANIITNDVQGGRAPLIVSEPGLYSLVLRSRKPEARAFKRWITHEVLPQIRKTGGYIPTQPGDSDLDILARAVLVAQKTITQKDALIHQQQQTLAAQAPKVRFAEALETSPDTISVGTFAKLIKQKTGLDIGQNRLFAHLRADGWLMSRRGADWNKPTQKALERGLMQVETRVRQGFSATHIQHTPKITTKGQNFFLKEFSVIPSIAQATH